MTEMDEMEGEPQMSERTIAGMPQQKAIGIAIILVVIIGIGYMLMTGTIELENKKTKILLIGSSSQEVIDILNENRETVEYDMKTVEALENNAKEQIKPYNIIILDQSEQAKKEITKNIGDSIFEFVKEGGNLIVVKDSGIRRPDTADIIGWKNTFGDLVPVNCDRMVNNNPTCTERILLRGKLYTENSKHPIMNGVDFYPVEAELFASFETFDIDVTGTQIAYLKSSGQDGKSYPAIAEKKTLLGKVVYFNYNPGKTRGILENTIDYLK